MQYKYHIEPLAVQKIRSFYRNVFHRYSNTYSYDDMLTYIDNTIDSINSSEQTLLRRRPTISRWQNWHMAHSGNWYYAYSIDGDTIVIHDACHQQNMHEDKKR